MTAQFPKENKKGQLLMKRIPIVQELVGLLITVNLKSSLEKYYYVFSFLHIYCFSCTAS